MLPLIAIVSFIEWKWNLKNLGFFKITWLFWTCSLYKMVHIYIIYMNGITFFLSNNCFYICAVNTVWWISWPTSILFRNSSFCPPSPLITSLYIIILYWIWKAKKYIMISQIIAIGLRFKLSYRVICKRMEKKNSDGGLLTQMQ